MNHETHVSLMEDESLVILLKYSIPILENEIHIQMKLEVMINSKIIQKHMLSNVLITEGFNIIRKILKYEYFFVKLKYPKQAKLIF